MMTSNFSFKSGHELKEVFYLPSLSWHCLSSFGPDDKVTQTATITYGGRNGQMTLITSGVFIHPAWSIEWEKSDLPSLSPQPPMLTPDWTWFGWRPTTSTTSYTGGNASPTIAWATPTSGSYRSSGPNSIDIFLFLVVGVPLISAFILVCGVWCCCCARGKRKERKAAQLAASGIDLGTVAPGPSPRPHSPLPAPIYEPPVSAHVDVDVEPPPPYTKNRDDV